MCRLTGDDSSGGLGSPRVVLHNVDGDFVLLPWTETRLDERVLRRGECTQDFSVFFFLRGKTSHA